MVSISWLSRYDLMPDWAAKIASRSKFLDKLMIERVLTPFVQFISTIWEDLGATANRRAKAKTLRGDLLFFYMRLPTGLRDLDLIRKKQLRLLSNIQASSWPCLRVLVRP